jgi:hypothetical protein
MIQWNLFLINNLTQRMPAIQRQKYGHDSQVGFDAIRVKKKKTCFQSLALHCGPSQLESLCVVFLF